MRFRPRQPPPYQPGPPPGHPHIHQRPGYPPAGQTRRYGNRTRLVVPTLGCPPLLLAASRVFVGMVAVGLVVLWSVIISTNGLGFGMDSAGLMLIVLLVCCLLAKSGLDLRRDRIWARRVCLFVSATVGLFCLVAAMSTYEGSGRVVALAVAAAAVSVIGLLHFDSRRRGG